MDLIPGFLQGVIRVIISYPFDYIRTNLQAQHNSSLFSYVSHHKLSIRDAYRGCTLPLLTVPIDRSIQFLLFERLSKEHSVITSSIASSLISSTYSVPVNFLSTYIITQHTKLTLDNIRSFIKKSNYYTSTEIRTIDSNFSFSLRDFSFLPKYISIESLSIHEKFFNNIHICFCRCLFHYTYRIKWINKRP